MFSFFFFFQAEDGIRDKLVTGVQTCALPICFILAGMAVLVAACSLDYRATVPPVEDEIVVQAVSDPQAAYDQPVRLSEQDLARILKRVRVQFTAHWLQRILTGPIQPVPLFDEPTLAKEIGRASCRERG